MVVERGGVPLENNVVERSSHYMRRQPSLRLNRRICPVRMDTAFLIWLQLNRLGFDPRVGIRRKQLTTPSIFDVVRPPRSASSIILLPDLSWKHFLRDLKAGIIDQKCLVTEEATDSIFSFEADKYALRFKSAEPNSALEELFAAQSLDA